MDTFVEAYLEAVINVCSFKNLPPIIVKVHELSSIRKNDSQQYQIQQQTLL
jgi:hypothetical protein